MYECSTILVSNFHQFLCNADFAHGMTCIGNDHELTMGYSLVKLPGRFGGTNHVIPPLDNVNGNIFQFLCAMLENKSFLKKNTINKIMTFDSCKGGCKIWIVRL